MLRIGITGGIGVGKSTVCKIFEELGVPVFNSDVSAREAERFASIQTEFKRILGDDIFIDGKLDRPKMRDIIFKDKDKLKEINNIVIPHVRDDFNRFCELHSKQPYVILESAILFETGADKNFDYIITVTAENNTKLERVKTRDGLTEDEIINKMNNQLSDDHKRYKSSFVITNNGEDLDEQVCEIHGVICRLVLNKNREEHE